MNFDDLSARWQQQASPAAPFPGPDSLNSLLTSQGPVAKMRRNAYRLAQPISSNQPHHHLGGMRRWRLAVHG